MPYPYAPDEATRSPAASGVGSAKGTGELLRLLLTHGAMTRSELIESTGLARSTVGSRLERLINAGLVQNQRADASTGGRPATRISFRPDAYAVLAADLGATHATVALTDLGGTIRARRTRALHIADGPEPALTWLVEAARELQAATGVAPGSLAGIGIGLPGPVEHTSGVPIKPPIMPGWDRFPVSTWVEERLGAPVHVDNDVNMMALGEHTAVHSSVENLVFVKVATGIGAGLICGRRLHRGAVGSAGDLGHVQAPHGRDTPCHCGNTGCLEAVAGGKALAAKVLPERAGEEDLGTRELVELLARHDRAAVAALRRAGQDLGEVLATVVNLLNPSVIVVAGSLAEAAPSLLAGVREQVFARSLPLATSELTVVSSQLGDDAAIVGAAATVIEDFLHPDNVDRLVASLSA